MAEAPAQVFSEDPILLPEIVDQIVLVTVHPASEREDEELQRRRHSLRLLGRLDQHRPSLGRFFAPYGAPLPRQFDLFRVSMAGQLIGVEAPDTLWRTLQVTPYVVGEAFRSSATSERDVDDAGRDRG